MNTVGFTGADNWVMKFSEHLINCIDHYISIH